MNTVSPVEEINPQEPVEAKIPPMRWLTVGVISLLQLVENSEGGLVNSLFR